jgi:hypothetical protein
MALGEILRVAAAIAEVTKVPKVTPALASGRKPKNPKA